MGGYMQGPRVDVHMNVYGNFCFRAQVDEISIHRLNTIILFFFPIQLYITLRSCVRLHIKVGPLPCVDYEASLSMTLVVFDYEVGRKSVYPLSLKTRIRMYK